MYIHIYIYIYVYIYIERERERERHVHLVKDIYSILLTIIMFNDLIYYETRQYTYKIAEAAGDHDGDPAAPAAVYEPERAFGSRLERLLAFGSLLPKRGGEDTAD